MTTLATILVTDATQPTKAIEVQRVARALDLAAHAIRAAGGAVTSGSIIDSGGVAIGSWTLTGTAPS